MSSSVCPSASVAEPESVHWSSCWIWPWAVAKSLLFGSWQIIGGCEVTLVWMNEVRSSRSVFRPIHVENHDKCSCDSACMSPRRKDGWGQSRSRSITTVVATWLMSKARASAAYAWRRSQSTAWWHAVAALAASSTSTPSESLHSEHCPPGAVQPLRSLEVGWPTTLTFPVHVIQSKAEHHV